MTLPTLPPELLDAILTHLPTPSLPALALTAHIFTAPAARHLQFRVIRTKLGNVQLWARLARADDLAAGMVREVTILGDVDVDGSWAVEEGRVPRGFECGEGEEEERAEELFVKALGRMTALTHFRWLRVPPPSDERLWDALNALGTVERLHVLDQSLSRKPIVRCESFLRIRGLKHLKVRTTAFDREADRGTAMLQKMLVPRVKGAHDRTGN